VKPIKNIFPIFFIPFAFLLLIWSIHLLGLSLHIELAEWGVYPRSLNGLKGIIFSPLIHDSRNFDHIVNNSISFALLGGGLFYFYRPLALKVFIFSYLISGFWVWVAGREAYHIGASGMVYGIAAFLFLSGIIRRATRLMAVSLLVVFLYGSMIWGIFPFIPDISWESHLSGLIAGIILSFLYRNEGPQREIYEWEFEVDNDELEDNEIEMGKEIKWEEKNKYDN